VKLLLIGHGRMGQLVEALAPSYGATIAGILDSANNAGGAALTPDRWTDVDVIVELSHAEPFLANLPALLALKKNLVIGTTGWKPHDAAVRQAIDAAGVGAVVAANFSVGATIFEALAEAAATLFQTQADYGAWLHEGHHAAKRDAPSGTALSLRSTMERAGYARPIDISSTRAGFMPGTHSIGFDGLADAVTMTHTVRDRATFAHGALAAAQWVTGKRGWFTMRDVIGI
jgi:4-hydroxy-tetrahydrodipicolinate reductase